MKRVASLLVLSVAAFGVAACGGTAGARGYLYRYGNGESFIQWQRDGRHVRGTISDTQFAATGPAHLLGGSLTVNGTVSGSNVVLHLSNGVTLGGRLSSFGLVLESESVGQPPNRVRYRPATVADYDAAVAQTKATVIRQKLRQSH